MTNEQLTCVISGSFKFKPEIDELYDELQDNGIRVLAPDKGWLYAQPQRSRVLFPEGFRPLPAEKGMSALEVEQSFLQHLGNASLVYLFNEEGYIGEMAAFELGHAVGWKKPVYARRELEPQEFAVENLDLWTHLKNYVRVVPIPEISEDYHRRAGAGVATAS